MTRQRGFGLAIYAVIALAAVGTLAGLYWGIDRAGHARGYAKANAECEEAARIQREAEMGQANLAATNLETANAKAKVVYRTITRTVDRYIDRPIYRNVCLDADGLRDVNAALAGAAADSGEPDGAVPGARAAARRDGGHGPP